MKMIPTTRNKKTSRLPASCSECQRRKQKCSRQWPCNHCQNRRISHLCYFVHERSIRPPGNNGDRTEPLKNGGEILQGPSHASDTDVSTATRESDLRALGYLPDFQNDRDEFRNSAASFENKHETQGLLSPEMELALKTLPPKLYTDIIVQHFLGHTNYHYYCLYPPIFTESYASWWMGRARGEALDPIFTCLLLRTCAYALQFVTGEISQKLEVEIGETSQALSENCHLAARRISSTISPGKGGVTQVQQLFLTSAWYKNEALFIEAWHALAAAIHEAQELGMNKSISTTMITEFDCETRRRVWSLLYVWDWQMSTLLSRPLIINDSACSLELPSIRLEDPDTCLGPPSPIAHIVLQCQLGRAIRNISGVANTSLSSLYADTIRQEVETWLTSLPPSYRITNTDTQWDEDFRYVVLQRCQLHVIYYMVLLSPLKEQLTKDLNSGSPHTQRKLRADAVAISLKLVEASRQLFHCTFPATAKFHFGPFLIFDTASFLCSAMIHDSTCSIPQRDSVIKAIGLALDMTEQLSRHTKVGAICLTVLRKLVIRLPISSAERLFLHKTEPEDSYVVSEYSEIPQCQNLGSSLDTCTGFAVPYSTIPKTYTPLDYTPPEMEPAEYLDLRHLIDVNFDELAQVWDWSNLELSSDFFLPLPM